MRDIFNTELANLILPVWLQAESVNNRPNLLPKTNHGKVPREENRPKSPFRHLKGWIRHFDRRYIISNHVCDGIRAKLIRLCKMSLSDTNSSVKIGSDFSEPFTTTRDLRQDDSLSCKFFNILMEKILENAKVTKTRCYWFFYKNWERVVLKGFGGKWGQDEGNTSNCKRRRKKAEQLLQAIATSRMWTNLYTSNPS